MKGIKEILVSRADLMREITLPIGIDYMAGASATSSGVITIKKDIDTDGGTSRFFCPDI